MRNKIKLSGNFLKEKIIYIVTLAATFVALALIVGLTFGSFYVTAKKDATTIGKMSITEEAQRISDRLLLGSNTLKISSLTIEHMIGNSTSPEDMQNYLITESEEIKRDIDPTFSSVYGVVNGTYIDGDGTDWVPEGYDPYSRDWYKTAVENEGKQVIAPPYVDAQTGKIIISFCRLLSDGVSVISLDKQMDEIYEAAKNMQVNGKGYCFVLDESGLVVAHRFESEKGKNYLSEDNPEEIRSITRTILDSEDGFWETTVGGEKCMIFSQSVQGAWHLILLVNSKDLYKDTRSSLIKSIVISLAIFVFLGYFCTMSYLNRKKAMRYADEVRTDKLTGLNNRGEYDRYIQVLSETENINKTIYLILFDVDEFKAVNDEYGHTEGDRALRLYAEAIRTVCGEKPGCFCARYGGDEFVVVIQCDTLEEAQAVPLEITEKLALLKKEHDLPYRFTISYGVSEYDRSKQSPPELVDAADLKLYEMKQSKDLRHR